MDRIAENTFATRESFAGYGTILLVEHEKDMLDLLEKVLLEHGYHVFTAIDGEKALEIYWDHKQTIDAVLLDIGLRKIAGRDLLHKIKDENPNVKIARRLFRTRITDQGPVLEPITEGSPLQVGDLVTVRLELNVDRPLEYMQLRDLRAAALEPVDYISGYRYSGGLGYYQAIRDASMNFFFDRIQRGTYVLEYRLRVSQAGIFRHGFAEIQSMHAPEFGSHTGGMIVKVSE